MAPQIIQGKCRLCQKEHVLVDSHIIADFLYTPLKKAEKVFWKLSPDPAQKPVKGQKGITEYLLCRECDNKIGKNESHFAQVLDGRAATWSRIAPGILAVSGYDYKKLKNALLAMLWRMSITTRDFFSGVDLGDKHNEILRAGLYADKEFAEEEYPIFLSVPVLKGGMRGNLMVRPQSCRALSNRVYFCVVTGYMYHFVVGSAPLRKVHFPLVLRRSGWFYTEKSYMDIAFLADLSRAITVPPKPR